MSVAQSNPVLFVLVGLAASLAPDLNRMLESYRLQAIDCVIVPDNDVTHLRAEINRIQQDFLTHRYATAGLVRVGYILHDASYFLDLRAHVENILSPLYPSGLITDIYWLTNETSTLDEDHNNRVSTMEVLAEGLPEAQIYMLSNLNSESHHTPWFDVLQTITMLTLFKDGEPREYAAPPDASRYNEFLFLRNADRGKPFLTAGSQQLKIPQKALHAVLLTALLSPLPLLAPEAPALNMSPITPWQPEAEYIYGLALPPESSKIITDGMTCRTIINRLFGERLNVASQMNPPLFDMPDPQVLTQSLDEYGLFEALAISSDEGLWLTVINEAIADNERAIQTAQQSLDKWLDARQDLKKMNADRRKFSFLHTVANYPYVLAAEYLRRINALSAMTQRGEVLARYVQIINDIHVMLEVKHQALKEIREPYETASTALVSNQSDSPLATTDNYFLGLFARHATENEATLRELTQSYREMVDLPALENYIKEVLLADPVFSRSFTDMLAQVADDKIITEWVTAQSHTHIRLRTGNANLYHEANLHMPPMWAAKVKYGYEAQGLGRANLFTDSAARGVSVVYHVGSFGAGDLYYADLYK